MTSRKAGTAKWQMMEMGDGITTSNGLWYHINKQQIEKYIPGLLKSEPLEKIIRQADAWTLSADGISLLLYFTLAYLTITPLYAAILSLIFYFIWYNQMSAFVNVGLSKIITIFANDGFLYGVSAILLIGMSLNSISTGLTISIDVGLDAVWYGIPLVFFYKVGLLRLIIRFYQSRKKTPKPELNDRVLNMLLIRYGMKHGVLTKSVNEMQDELIRLANYHKTRNRK